MSRLRRRFFPPNIHSGVSSQSLSAAVSISSGFPSWSADAAVSAATRVGGVIGRVWIRVCGWRGREAAVGVVLCVCSCLGV